MIVSSDERPRNSQHCFTSYVLSCKTSRERVSYEYSFASLARNCELFPLAYSYF